MAGDAAPLLRAWTFGSCGFDPHSLRSERKEPVGEETTTGSRAAGWEAGRPLGGTA
jgi:hypothetical protein